MIDNDNNKVISNNNISGLQTLKASVLMVCLIVIKFIDNHKFKSFNDSNHLNLSFWQKREEREDFNGIIYSKYPRWSGKKIFLVKPLYFTFSSWRIRRHPDRVSADGANSHLMDSWRIAHIHDASVSPPFSVYEVSVDGTDTISRPPRIQLPLPKTAVWWLMSA